ncbi:MAG: GMC family oxidoreductase [Campylobacteraceae bacterium]|nr:GMC family oxidoreductase [Campylobacteraceae bacterium]
MTILKYDFVIVGTGFSSSFFLHKLVEHKDFNKFKILVLERGSLETHEEKVKNRILWQQGHGVTSKTNYKNTFINNNENKEWVYTPSFGGSSNCWWGCTPRMLPNDFKMKSTFGVGYDWPISYNDLEPYYSEAENIMQISGDMQAPYCMSHKYPLPPHRLSSFDSIMKKEYPSQYFSMPCARPSVAIESAPRCCASSVCHLCPIDSKFTILSRMNKLYLHKNIDILYDAQALFFDHKYGFAKNITYQKNNINYIVELKYLVLGANAIFNAHILLNSKIENSLIGKGLAEQVSIDVKVPLQAGIKNFDGSTSLTGHGYMLYDGDHRRQYAACLIESNNIPGGFRLEKGKTTSVAYFKLIFEDIPDYKYNFIEASKDIRLPILNYKQYSDYTARGIFQAKEKFLDMLKQFPIDGEIIFGVSSKTEGHIMGTTKMGKEEKDSVVDENLKVLYRYMLLIN